MHSLKIASLFAFIMIVGIQTDQDRLLIHQRCEKHRRACRLRAAASARRIRVLGGTENYTSRHAASLAANGQYRACDWENLTSHRPPQ